MTRHAYAAPHHERTWGHTDWRDRAACADPYGQYLMGMVHDQHPHNPKWPCKPTRLCVECVAKALCRTCPVRQACLDHALTNDEQDGIWGGHTAAERRAMANNRETG